MEGRGGEGGHTDGGKVCTCMQGMDIWHISRRFRYCHCIANVNTGVSPNGFPNTSIVTTVNNELIIYRYASRC